MALKDTIMQCNEIRTNHPPVLIMGVGNILMGDDGVGVHAVYAMQKMTLPGDIELVDGGTATMSFLSSFSDREKVIIIDAVKAGNPPGTIYRFSPGDIYMQKETATSLHQVGIIEAITLSGFIDDRTGDIIIYGIEPGTIECGITLSSEVVAGLPKLIEQICGDLNIII